MKLSRRSIPGGVVGTGGSLGGIVVGSAALLRPDLFAGVLLGAPVADCLRYYHFGFGIDAEMGDPRKEDDFRHLLAVSPYHLVKEGERYPPFLILSSQTDGRSGAAHARKLAAALEAAHPKNEVLLRVDWSGGHFGPLDSGERNARLADSLAFAWDVTHRAPGPAAR
jgi:prolyl oligopeptidase